MKTQGKTDDILVSEIEKWTKKIAAEMENAEHACPKGKEMIVNIKAYVSDSSHFMREGDLVRSFEAIIWAWAWLEIGLNLGYIAKEYVDIRKIKDK